MALQPSGIMFHHFHGGKHASDGNGSVSASDLSTLIREIGRGNFLSAGEWIQEFLENGRAPEKFFLTFDDGLLSQFDVALPVLEDWKLSAFWFIYSSPFEGKPADIEIFRKFKYSCFSGIDSYHALFFAKIPEVVDKSSASQGFRIFLTNYQSVFPFYSEAEILYRYIRDRVLSVSAYSELVYSLMESMGVDREELALDIWMDSKMLETLGTAGHELGLHSYTHPTSIAQRPRANQNEEFQRNFNHLTGLGGKVISAAHPCNSYSTETLEILLGLGIKFGFRSNNSNVGVLSEPRSNLEFPRTDISLLR